jgi:hypothetical protein
VVVSPGYCKGGKFFDLQFIPSFVDYRSSIAECRSHPIQFTDKATEADLKKKAAETNKAPRSEADAKAAIARAELDVLKANVELASSVVLQIQLRLTAAKNASSKEIQASEAELRVAQARLEQARAALSAAEKKLPK